MANLRLLIEQMSMEARRRFGIVCCVIILVALGASGCSNKARIVNTVKEVPISGALDTVFFERSKYWDREQPEARVDSNRQTITFRPSGKDVAYAILQNMGGVPLRRDTIRGQKSIPAEQYLRTVTRDTNLRLHVEFSDWRRPATDIIVYLRNRDSVYREVLVRGK